MRGLFVRGLSEEEREALLSMLDSPAGLRARIILLSEEGKRPRDIAAITGLTTRTCCKWIREFNRGGLEALSSRPAHPVIFSLPAEVRERLAELALTPPRQLGLPQDHWSLRRLARYLAENMAEVDCPAVRISHEAVRAALLQRGIRLPRRKRQSSRQELDLRGDGAEPGQGCPRYARQPTRSRELIGIATQEEKP